MKKRINVRVVEARRLNDPNFPGAVEHVFTINALDLPHLPLGANPREQNTNKRVYSDVRKSLLNQFGTPNSFLGKNLGIYACAAAVNKQNDTEFELVFGEADSILEGLDGVINGGHTAKIILDSQDELRERADADDGISQFVKLHVRVGYPRDVLADMAGALNTTLQVPAYSLAEHADQFAWIHESIAGKPYETSIAFKENVSAPYYVLDVLAMLDLFNTFEFPNEGTRHPTQAYAQKSGVLERYLDNPSAFERLAPILNDILVLHDLIASGGAEKYREFFRNGNGPQKKGDAARLEWIDVRKKGTFNFPFIQAESAEKLNRAAIYPAMAAFRWMVDDDDSKQTVRWKDGGFDEVREMWDRVGPEMMRMTQDTSVENGRKTLAIGKSSTHYNALHSAIAKYQLIRRASA